MKDVRKLVSRFPIEALALVLAIFEDQEQSEVDVGPDDIVAALSRDFVIYGPLAAAFDPLDRATRFRVLEAACVLRGDDLYAAAFRKERDRMTEEG